MAAKWSMLIVLRTSFGINFLCISPLHENLYFVTFIIRNACCCFSRPPILASKVHPITMFVQGTFLDTLLFNFILISYKIVDLGTSSKSSGGQDATQNLVTSHVLSKTKIWDFPAPENLIRDLFLQSSLPRPPPLYMLDRHGLALDSLLDRFQTPFY